MRPLAPETGSLKAVKLPPTGAVSLSRALANAPEAHACAAQQMLTFAISGEPMDSQSEALRVLSTGNEGFSMRTALQKIATSRIVKQRVPSQEEAKQ